MNLCMAFLMDLYNHDMKGIHNISSFKKYFLKTFKLPRQVAKDCPSIRPSHLVTEITTVNQVIIFEIIYRTD